MNATSYAPSRAVLLATVLAAAMLLSSCGGSASPKPPAASISSAAFDPADFGDPATGANPYLPIKPGTQSVREGFTRVGGRVVTPSGDDDDHRRLPRDRRCPDGADARPRDRRWSGLPDLPGLRRRGQAGQRLDLGGYTEGYEGGRFVSALDTWLQGVNGAKAGILVQAKPKLATPLYAVSQPDGEEGDVAEVVKIGIHRCVPFDCFSDVLVVREGKASAPDNEFKYYARDVGQIDNVPRGASVHKDVERMVNLTYLSPQALAEFSKEALRLDRHAAQQAPKVFGGKPGARRG